MNACNAPECLDRASCRTHIMNRADAGPVEDYSKTCGAEAPFCDGWSPMIRLPCLQSTVDRGRSIA